MKKCKDATKNWGGHPNRLGNLAETPTTIHNERRQHRADGGCVHILRDTRERGGRSGAVAKNIFAANKYDEAWKRGMIGVQSLWHVPHQLYAEYERAATPRITMTVPQPSPQTSGTHENPGTSLKFQESFPHPPREVLVDEQGHTILLEDNNFPEYSLNSTEAGWEAEEHHTNVRGKTPASDPMSDSDPLFPPEAAEGVIAHFTEAAHEGGAPL
ncbi:unnamed protein product [Trypanosoma congolense IL3000]|uniref:WGS project CAEQ00000000 data, annotated contig 107 n=1 Tax=Trypanosoma congolense (strain IL3000) TaxID=1068625 RepID=F9W3M3_TRYCI|nr:unnamed protein product [Trypanosoma congolense IL3000]